jgi:hypothetical protein
MSRCISHFCIRKLAFAYVKANTGGTASLRYLTLRQRYVREPAGSCFMLEAIPARCLDIVKTHFFSDVFDIPARPNVAGHAAKWLSLEAYYSHNTTTHLCHSLH